MAELKPIMAPLARGMLEQDVVKFGEFTLKDGRKSRAYANLRDMISIPDLYSQAVGAYVTTIANSGMGLKPTGEPRYLMGIPEAATYYAGAVGRWTRMPLLYRRVNPKEHGQPRPIEGRFQPGDEVVLLDDVITSAKSKLDEAAGLAEAELVTKGVVVLVDREQGGRTEITNRGIDFAAAMTLSGIAKYAVDENLAGVTQTLYDDLLAELDPQELAT